MVTLELASQWCLPGFTSVLNVLAVHSVVGADLSIVLGRQVQVSKSLKNTISESVNPVPWTRQPPNVPGCQGHPSSTAQVHSLQTTGLL